MKGMCWLRQRPKLLLTFIWGVAGVGVVVRVVLLLLVLMAVNLQATPSESKLPAQVQGHQHHNLRVSTEP